MSALSEQGLFTHSLATIADPWQGTLEYLSFESTLLAERGVALRIALQGLQASRTIAT